MAIAAALGLAALEYASLFKRSGRRPATVMTVIGVVLLVLSRHLFGFEHAPLILTLLCLASLIWHLIDYELGASNSGSDFAVTLSGVVYLGWVGSYLVSLRGLIDGTWWVLLALPAIWLADSAAYFVGRAIGRHRLSPRLSPKKSWEGYLAGVLVGAAATAGLAALWRVGAGPGSPVSAGLGSIVGVVVGVLAPVGDLGVSMLKREMQVKDTGALLPGHGGALDRIDTWIWAGVLGYYVVVWFTR